MAHYNPKLNSWVSGNHQVSEEDAALLQKCQHYSAIGPMDIASHWKTRIGQLKAEKLQPYADLLFTHLAVQMRLDSVRQKLLDSIKKATSEKSICYKHPYTYKHTVPIECLSERLARLSALDVEARHAENVKHVRTRTYIQHNHLEDMMSITKTSASGEEESILYPVRVADILRHTDLLKRLALEFGGPFCYAQVKPVEEKTDEERGIHIFTSAIFIYYKPFGLNKYYLQETIAFLKKTEAREKRMLGKGEVLRLGAPICECSVCKPYWREDGGDEEDGGW